MWGFCVCLCFCYALLGVLSSFAFILKMNRELGALLLLFKRCLITITVLWLFIRVPLVGPQCVVVVCPDHFFIQNGAKWPLTTVLYFVCNTFYKTKLLLVF